MSNFLDILRLLVVQVYNRTVPLDLGAVRVCYRDVMPYDVVVIGISTDAVGPMKEVC